MNHGRTGRWWMAWWLIAGLWSPLLAQEEDTTKTWWQTHVNPGLLVETETAVGLKAPTKQKLELLLWPQADINLAAKTDLRAIGRVRFDGFDNLEPGKPKEREVSRASKRWIVNDQVDLELRELFLTTNAGRTTLTLGKQQIVWGKADGLKILDVVNPQDFQEFILDDFDKSRIPLWAVNAEIPLGKPVLQLVWIPDRTYHKLPEPAGVYDFRSPEFRPSPPPGVPITFNARQAYDTIRRPTRFFKDSDGGARLSAFVGGWDLTFNYLYHYTDIPVLRRFIRGTPLSPMIAITTTYERTHLIGTSFSNAFGSLTIRGEVGYSTDRFFLTEDLTDDDGEVNTDELAYVLGFDWFGITNSFLSVQVFQSVVTDDPTGMVRDQLDTSSTLLFQHNAMNERLRAEVLWLQNFNKQDGLVRPKLSYEVKSGVKVWGGFDVFYGTRKGLFGQFNRNDRMIVGGEWGF